jgi:hypothetical protein
MKAKGLKVDAKFYMEHQLMNPISQLFSLILEELPGCPKGGVDDREYIAGEYLFREALDACDKGARKRLAAKLGVTVEATQRRSPRLMESKTKPDAKPKTQAKLTMFAEKFLLDKLSKKKTPRSSPESSP